MTFQWVVPALLASILSLCAFADEPGEQPGEHSPNVCSVKAADLCAHLKFLGPLTSHEEAQFVLHILNELEAQDVKVDLWMDMGGGHGHGSAPVEISRFGVNKYKITKAYFVMTGPWQIRVNFSMNGESHQLIFPVNIIQ